jgi:16S rRNA (guanine527-N7)-methyltransferase
VEIGEEWADFVSRMDHLGIPLSPEQISQFQSYSSLLSEWNQHFNLTAVESLPNVLTRHFLDSAACATVVELPSIRSVIDIGAGAGFPGLVLKVLFPHIELTLLDAQQKRMDFVERVCRALSLTGVRALHARAEELSHPLKKEMVGPLRESFDLVTARAVARLNVLVEWTLPFARIGGQFLAMKGPAPQQEIEEASYAVRLLGGGKPSVSEFMLPGTEIGRSLVLIPKERQTPRSYPRMIGTARKDPLAPGNDRSSSPRAAHSGPAKGQTNRRKC